MRREDGLIENGLVLSIRRLLEALSIESASREALITAFNGLGEIRAVGDGEKRIWNNILDSAVDCILEFPSNSLIDDIKKFREIWRKVPLLTTDEDLYDKSSRCYHTLVNIELERLITRLNMGDWNQTRVALEELYHSGMMLWESIDDPYSVIFRLLEIIKDPDNISELILKRDRVLLVSRALRLYIDLEVQRQFEFILCKASKGNIEALIEAIKGAGSTAGTMLYTLTGLQLGVFASKRSNGHEYTSDDTVRWREYINTFESKVRKSLNRDSEDRIDFDIIFEELRQARDGIKCFPTNSSELIITIRRNIPSISLDVPLKALPGLLSMAYAAFKGLWSEGYADLLEERKKIATVCCAVTP